MTRSTKSSLKFSNVRRNNAKLKEEFLDIETQRQAKRIGRQQKRLEKETGIANVVNINTRQRVVRYEDIKELKPLTDTQYDFFEAWEDDQATGYMLSGSAGTGKTAISVAKGIMAVLDPQTPYKKLVIVRSSVQVRDQGFLKGDLSEKMEAFEAPYIGVLQELTGRKDAYQNLKDIGKIEFISTSAIRGITLNDAIVIADEVGAMNWHECKSILTRVGKNTKIIMIGDTAQVDLIYKKTDTTGIYDLIEVTRKMGGFRNFKFTEDDIVRSEFVREFLITCNNMGL